MSPVSRQSTSSTSTTFALASRSGSRATSPSGTRRSGAGHSNPYVPQQRSASPQNGANPAASPYVAPTKAEMEARPWQYMGYPEYTKWMASSPDFFLLRRFNRLNAWVQLHWQDEIVRLENELEEITKTCQRNRGRSAKSSTLRNDPMGRRDEILTALRPKLKEYNDFIISHSQLRDRATADHFQVDNVKNWMWNNDTAIDEPEQQWIDQRFDVIPLVEKKRPWLRIGIETLGAQYLTKLFPARLKKGRYESAEVKYSSNQRMDATMTLIIVTIGLGALLGPMWWLDAVTDDKKRLGVITGFIVVFTCILASATVQRPFEVLAGTAAYAAVLIVFLQQSSSSPSSTLSR